MNTFFEFLFPKRCAICNTPLVRGEKDMCLQCMLSSPYPRNPYEEYSGRITAMNVENIDIFLSYHYCEKAISDFKYRADLYKGRVLGRLWAQHLMRTDWIGQIELIVPIPLHPLKLRQRGFNQSEYLGRVLSKTLSIPLCAFALSRHRNNRPQVGSKDRWENVGGIFSLKNSSALQNKHILVIDDLITTSATTNALLSVLKGVEGLRVSVAALASVV